MFVNIFVQLIVLWFNVPFCRYGRVLFVAFYPRAKKSFNFIFYYE